MDSLSWSSIMISTCESYSLPYIIGKWILLFIRILSLHSSYSHSVRLLPTACLSTQSVSGASRWTHWYTSLKDRYSQACRRPHWSLVLLRDPEICKLQRGLPHLAVHLLGLWYRARWDQSKAFSLCRPETQRVDQYIYGQCLLDIYINILLVSTSHSKHVP